MKNPIKSTLLENLFVDLPIASLILILSLAFLVYMHKMCKQQLKGQQKELDRLAAENRQYRQAFLSGLPAIAEPPSESTRTEEKT